MYRRKFDDIRHEEDGIEYWYARELMKLLDHLVYGEIIHNSNFRGVEFDSFRNQTGSNGIVGEYSDERHFGKMNK